MTAELLPLPCPFCGSSNVSDGEILGDSLDRTCLTTQSMCMDCGATGPEAKLDKGEIDYGDVKAIAAWNRRPGKGEAVPSEGEMLDWAEANNAAWMPADGMWHGPWAARVLVRAPDLRSAILAAMSAEKGD